jgi:hypothetical protein
MIDGVGGGRRTSGQDGTLTLFMFMAFQYHLTRSLGEHILALDLFGFHRQLLECGNYNTSPATV